MLTANPLIIAGLIIVAIWVAAVFIFLHHHLKEKSTPSKTTPIKEKSTLSKTTSIQASPTQQNWETPATKHLFKKLLNLVNGDRQAALRLLSQAQNRNPNKTLNWYYEKVILDLERDRH